jgi:lysophospholipase L1-like esterase
MRYLPALLALATLLSGCASAAPVPREPAPTAPVAPVSTPAAAQPPTPTEAPKAVRTPEPALAVDDPDRVETVPELARFYRALRAHQAGALGRNVRVMWLGDSHGQADFWSGQLRARLAERFGAAGPGFVHLGYKNYRHDGLKLEIRGKWRMRPKKPTGVKRDGDGVFGLGGLMMSGYADSPRVELSLSPPFGAARSRFDVCYRLREAGDVLSVSGGGLPVRELRATKDAPAGAIRHLEVEASSSEPFVVRPIGRTDLCGVVVESASPESHGVVLDTLAINGARYGTALAWDADAWVAEATRRAPDLVVLELGTNEAGDPSPAYDAVARDMTELLGRVRRASPNADCVVVSPTDRADAETRTTRMHDVLAQAAERSGCVYFDAWKLLGGEGAMARLREEPEPTVQKDGIHLTIKGYRKLGDQMFDELMKGWAGRAP